MKQATAKGIKILIGAEKQKEHLIEEGRKESQKIIMQTKQQAQDMLEAQKESL